MAQKYIVEPEADGAESHKLLVETETDDPAAIEERVYMLYYYDDETFERSELETITVSQRDQTVEQVIERRLGFFFGGDVEYTLRRAR
jgi:hypothetical protein